MNTDLFDADAFFKEYTLDVPPNSFYSGAEIYSTKRHKERYQRMKKATPRVHVWSQEEKLFLEENNGRISIGKIAKELNIAKGVVSYQLIKMGL